MTPSAADDSDGRPAPEVFRSGGGEGDYLSRWKRVVTIDRQLRDQSFPTAASLAQACGVSTKTIYRDLEALRLEFDAPIVFDRQAGGYRYTDQRFALPAVTLSERDLFALMVAENAIEHYLGTPLHAYLREAFERVLSYLPGKVRERHELAARAVHFGGLPPARLEPSVWADLSAAIHAREEVELDYRLPKETDPVTRRVQPLLLVVREREWFLAAHYPEKAQTPLYYLPRVLAVRRLGSNFAPPQDFSPETYYRDGFNALRGPGGAEGVRRVELRFQAEFAHLADERAWAAEQAVQHEADGAAKVTFETSALFAVEREVLRYGGRIEVLEPAELRASLAEAGARIADRHA